MTLAHLSVVETTIQATEAPRRVAQIVTRFMAGAGVVALRGASALDPASNRVTIVAGSGDRLLDEARAAGFEVILVPGLVSPIDPRADAAALRELTSVLRAGHFDVVHTHSAKAGALGRVAARRAGIPRVVHTFHGFPFHEFQSWPRRSAYVWLERRLGAMTDFFLAVGTGVAVEAVRRGIAPPERIRTIGPAVGHDIPLATPESRRCARRSLGLPPGARVIGTVGRLDYQKAPEHLIKALALLRDRDPILVWVGDGPLADRAARAAVHHGVADRVRLLGDRADVPQLLPAFDIFAMASRYEGLPCAVLEAQRCGLPVVATAVNGTPDLVVPGVTGLLVPPQRPDLLARALQHLLDFPALAAGMAEQGHDQLNDRYEPVTLGRVLDEAYRISPPTSLARVG
jgi:glycosyltransferase involved in cell wall biosynthesis